MSGIVKVGSVLLIAAVTLPAATIGPTPAAPQSKFEGTTEYLPPLKGQAMVVGGRFTFLFGPADGSTPMVANAGTYEIVRDTVMSTVSYATDSTLVGMTFRWTIAAEAGDTLTWVVVGEAGQVTNRGRSVRVR